MRPCRVRTDASHPGQTHRHQPLRAPLRYDRKIHDQEFVQRVRRHLPASLVPIVARYGAAFAERERYLKPRSTQYAPWVLAEVARASLIYGTDFNRKPATDNDLLSCCAAYQSLADRELERREDGAVGNFFLRMAGEQLTFQQSVLNDLARTAALLEQTTPRKTLRTVSPGWSERLLGCKLTEYVGTAILLYTGALRNAGTFDLAWLTQPQFEEVTREIPADVLRPVIEKQYVASRDQLRTIQQKAEGRTGVPNRNYRRFGFNPLSSRPVVAGLTNTLVIPVPGFIVRRASPLGVYYTGMDKWGSGFSEDLGELFEVYVGRQLDLLPDARVIPEIAHGNNALSVDWFAVFDDCVVLVEAKSTRPTEPIRLADPRAGDELQRMLGRAVNQLNASADRVRSDQPGFEELPSDRPMVGLVVTMEPFHTVNIPFILGHLPQCDIPFAVCSALELEHLVTVSDVSVGRLLLDHLTGPNKKGWSVSSALTGHAHGRNAVIDEGWASYPWKEQPEFAGGA